MFFEWKSKGHPSFHYNFGKSSQFYLMVFYCNLGMFSRNFRKSCTEWVLSPYILEKSEFGVDTLFAKGIQS